MTAFNNADSSNKIMTRFMVKFTNDTLPSLTASINSKVNQPRKATNLSNFFTLLSDEAEMDCSDEESERPNPNKRQLNLLGLPLQTAHSSQSSASKLGRLVPEEQKLNSHLDTFNDTDNKINPIFHKLPFIPHVDNINPIDLSIDPTKNFRLDKNYAPWEYLLKVNRHSLTKDKFAQEIDTQFKLFELIYNEMQGKMYLSDRWAMDPRHNKDLMYSISKQRDLYAMQQPMNPPAKTATTAPSAKMHPQPKV